MSSGATDRCYRCRRTMWLAGLDVICYYCLQEINEMYQKGYLDAMPTIKITHEHILSDSQCPVCLERFELGSEARKMPCGHTYHKDCIVPWLLRRHTCPVCRFKLEPKGHASSCGNEIWGGGRNANGNRANGISRVKENGLLVNGWISQYHL